MRINATVRNDARDYDYVEVQRPATLLSSRAGYLLTLQTPAQLSAAKKSYDALTGRSLSARSRDRNRVLWLTLRLENEYRHEAATKNAPARMVANMLDNWPAWYPEHLKPTPDVAAEDAKRRAKKPRKRRLRPC